ncbi:hypothetical protein HHK36_006062 [Tetracentron sinense]|uniref:Rab-GAP TBC domain-containing protein n=1 Tax=Tetracentron sinense TaxID=13715 RepID=A0A834ZNQ8_TETSI|nr:hypothetical protein HHK36_006062 [Tetracentron sinense]
MILKGKFKLSEKARRSVPDMLGSLVAGFEDQEDEAGSLDLGFESGEELKTFQPNGFESENRNDDEKTDRESELRSPRKIDKDVLKPISASSIIAADEKRSDLEFELSQKVINLERLQRIASSGLPDEGGLRATAWKLLLGYLPASRDLWERELADNRLKYATLKEEMLLNPSEFARRKEEVLVCSDRDENSDVDGPLRRHEISHEDHPLSLGKASVWHRYFQDTEIAEQIDRDLQRTHPDMKFFSGDTSLSRKNREAMRNILLLFAKLNPAIRYVQGMNEVLALLYYVFSTDPDEQNALNAEADSFACFVRLLSDSVDHFCQQLDNSSVGIHSTLSRLAELLKANDEELWRHLEISNKEMLLRVCCAMLLCVRSRLLSGDFTANLKLLQHYPEINIEYLLRVAQELSPDTSSFHLSL